MEIDRHRILLSAYACEPNKGSEPGVGWNWAVHLADKYEVYVITRENNRSVIEKYIEDHPIAHLHFYYYDCSGLVKKIKKLPNGIFIYYRKWQKDIFPKVKKIVRDEQIELVHHVTFNEFRTPGKLYKLDIPFVWGPIGGGQFYSPIFRSAYFNRKDRTKELFRNFINHINLVLSIDVKNAVNQANTILIADQSTEKIMSDSRSYVRLLETAYNITRNHIKIYPVKVVEERIKLIWVGGIWPRKGLKVLIDALGRSDFRNFTLEIIGDGEDRDNCIKLVKLYGIDEQVRFCGKLSYDEVNEHYDEADVFLFTSIRDTSGNVILEAMSHGLPVITLDHHGAGEIVTNETGTKVAIRDYEQILGDIVKAIMYYYENPLEIEKKGRAARNRLEQCYSWEYNIREMCKVYEQIFREKMKYKNDL